MALTQIKATAVSGGGWIKLSTASADNSATSLNVDSGFSATYDDYMIAVHHVKAGDNSTMNAQLKIDGDWQGGAWYNFHINRGADDSSGYQGTGTHGANAFTLCGNWGSETGEHITGFIYLWDVNEANGHQKLNWTLVSDEGGTLQGVVGGKGIGSFHDDGVGSGNMVCSGIQIQSASGNISEGDFILYGLSK